MLVLTGVLLGCVLVVMVGESAHELEQAGWLSTTVLPLPLPQWVGVVVRPAGWARPGSSPERRAQGIVGSSPSAPGPRTGEQNTKDTKITKRSRSHLSRFSNLIILN
jgi:hypothetical protein